MVNESMEALGEYGITVSRSAGADGAVVVFIDGDFTETGLRILVNDNNVYAAPDYEGDPNDVGGREANQVELAFTLNDIDYVEDPYAAADADHKPVADANGDHYECHHQGRDTYCGLATLADGSRHGHLEGS